MPLRGRILLLEKARPRVQWKVKGQGDQWRRYHPPETGLHGSGSLWCLCPQTNYRPVSETKP